MSKKTKGRERITIEIGHDPELYQRILEAAQRNFNCANPPVGKFCLKVIRWYLNERGDQITSGL